MVVKLFHVYVYHHIYNGTYRQSRPACVKEARREHLIFVGLLYLQWLEI